jgi:hypothetical protein
MMVGLSATIVDEARVTRMRRDDPAGVFYRTPVLFGTGSYFPRISNQSIRIRAVGAVDLFDCIQIGEMSTVRDEVIRAMDLGKSIHGKTDCLVNTKKRRVAGAAQTLRKSLGL